jgi:hypothetical protein
MGSWALGLLGTRALELLGSQALGLKGSKSKLFYIFLWAILGLAQELKGSKGSKSKVKLKVQSPNLFVVFLCGPFLATKESLQKIDFILQSHLLCIPAPVRSSQPKLFYIGTLSFDLPNSWQKNVKKLLNYWYFGLVFLQNRRDVLDAFLGAFST